MPFDFTSQRAPEVERLPCKLYPRGTATVLRGGLSAVFTNVDYDVRGCECRRVGFSRPAVYNRVIHQLGSRSETMPNRLTTASSNDGRRFLRSSTIVAVAIFAANFGQFVAAQAPQTMTLTGGEAQDALHRDWLFQAMDEPLAERTAKEIAWAEQLADRLSRSIPPPDLSKERAELASLKRRLDQSNTAGTHRSSAPLAPNAAAAPSWIWYPEGRPAEDAPAAARYFRCRFELPSAARLAELHVAADDACEVYVNGVRVGANDTWRQAAVFSVAKLLKPGRNLLAVRAENRPAPSKNPAGLIFRLAIVPVAGGATVVVSDGSWRASREAVPRWEQPELDDSAWKAAAIAAPYGGGPWARIGGLGIPDAQSDPLAAYANVDPEVRDLYFAVREVKRKVLFKNPVIDFSQLLFIDQPLPQGPESSHEAIHRMGIMAVPGGRLVVLDGLHPGGRLRKLAPDKPGAFWRPDLSFDARKVLFCYKPQDEKSFHLYEMNLDGTGLRQLTRSAYDDIDPIYLPDGHILFTTTRGNSYVRCGPFIYSYILARCDADGSNVYLISCNGEPDFVPALLNDGRVIYSRWEYT